MPGLACLNGELMPADEARVSIWDRGFLFGDAVYEVYRLYAGRLWLEEPHTKRLRRSLMELEFPPVDFERFHERMRRTIAASGIREGTVYVQITRGAAPRRHAFPPAGTPLTELLVVLPYDDSPMARLRETGGSLISYLDLRWKRCDIKTVNLLGNVLANEAAHRAGAHEAVLIDDQGRVTEATHSSVLWVRGGVLCGTPEGHEILPGTTRGFILSLARQEGIPFEAGVIRLEEFAQSDEILVFATSTEVLPIIQLDDRPVGDGRPGPIARRLQAAFRRSLDAWLAGG